MDNLTTRPCCFSRGGLDGLGSTAGARVAFGLLIPILALQGISKNAWASAPAPLACQSSLRIKEVLYSAVFKWSPKTSSAATNSLKPGQTLRILVGSTEGRPSSLSKTQLKSKWTGVISTVSGQCQAICQAAPMDADGIQLRCQGANFNALSVPAAIFWSQGLLKKDRPGIRFGSWLSGYQHAPLKVEVDHFIKLEPTSRLQSKSGSQVLAQALALLTK